MRQDGGLQLLKGPARVYPELLGQNLAGLPKRSERFPLPTRAVQAEQQLVVQPFPQWMLHYQPSQLPDQLGVPSDSKI